MQTTTLEKKPGAVSGQTIIGNETSQYLTFFLAGELFAVGILAIKEIIQYGQITTVPLMPGYIRGVINLRGAVVPVIDSHSRFGRGCASIGKRTCIVIIEVRSGGETHDVGIMVDGVSAVVDIARNQIEPPPNFGTSVNADFIDGMGKIGEQFVIILDVDRTFSLVDFTALETSAIN